MTGISLEPVPRPDTLAGQAHERVREALMSGRLSPGQRITIRGLADALAISFTPAREAIMRLAAEGALELGAGRSVIVPEMTRRRFDEVMEIRLRLETLAVEAAAVRITDAEIAAAHAIQDRQLAHYRARDYKAVLQCNEDFHFQIYRASGLPILVQIVEALWLKVGPTLNLLHTNYSAGWRGDENHRAILAALEQHDAAAAAAAVRRDLIDGKARLDGLLPD